MLGWMRKLISNRTCNMNSSEKKSNSFKRLLINSYECHSENIYVVSSSWHWKEILKTFTCLLALLQLCNCHKRGGSWLESLLSLSFHSCQYLVMIIVSLKIFFYILDWWWILLIVQILSIRLFGRWILIPRLNWFSIYPGINFVAHW